MKEKTDDHRVGKRAKKIKKALGCACPHLSDGGRTPYWAPETSSKRAFNAERNAFEKAAAEYRKNKFFGNFYIYY